MTTFNIRPLKVIKQLFLLIFLSVTSDIFGQSIRDLEFDLTQYSSFEENGAKIDKAWKLLETDPFNKIATEYICRYYSEREIDSVSIYFDNLIARFSNNPKPIILRTELLFLELDYQQRDEYNKHKIEYLNQALNISPNDTSIIFKLAETYYKDFIFPLEKNREYSWRYSSDGANDDSSLIDQKNKIKRSAFEHSADSGLKYLYQIWELEKERRELIYYSIRQLECYTNRTESSPVPKNFEATLKQCYFPISYFANLSEKWECDFTTDYLFEIEWAKDAADWLELQLNDLKENCLFNLEVQPKTTIYRFTWLRSFDNPVAIRIENNENEITLYWKTGKGFGGYEPKGLKKSGKKKLSSIEWEKFEKLVSEADFDSSLNYDWFPMNDGASWTLERKKYNSFKAHRTNMPQSDFKAACLYLLNLANIKVKDDKIY